MSCTDLARIVERASAAKRPEEESGLVRFDAARCYRYFRCPAENKHCDICRVFQMRSQDVPPGLTADVMLSRKCAAW